jgi:predicted ATPase
VALAERLAHPYTCGVTLDFVSQVFCELREVPIVQTHMDGQFALCREQEFREGLARGMITRGWILAQQGQAKEGIDRIREGIAICEAIGTQMDRSHHLAVLAEVYALNGQPDEGLAVLEEALQHVEKTGGRYYEAEIYRLKGELLLTQEIKRQKAKRKSQKLENTDPRPLTPDPQTEAEACFLKAIEIAQQQQAKSLELRAVVSLVRLRQHQAQDHEPRNTQHEARIWLDKAHQMLSEIFGWFTEGFETADLQEAKALLEELSH